MTKNLPKFLQEGMRFQCQGTGRCCVSRGTYGYVYLNIHDRRRFAKYFKMKTQAFTRKYCLKHDGFYYLAESEKQCRFLEGKACGVYEARPNQCRTWPFWPEHMTPKSWGEVARFCQGIGKGPLLSPEHIQATLALND
jgi:Fe-S-cluster containining protein